MTTNILNSVSAINWNGKDWAMQCDFKGNDLSNVRIAGEYCSTKCRETSGCTHFSWTSYNGGTCWMKKGTVSQSNAVPLNDPTSVCGIVTKTQPQGPSPSPGGGSSVEQRVFELTNQARRVGRSCGGVYYAAAPALTWNNQLGNAARGHAADMVRQNYFDHTSRDGRSFVDRIVNAGYSRNCAAAENIAGNSNPDATVDGWIKSPGHCANMMNKDFKAIGVGQATGGTYGAYWVQNFGRC